MRQESFGQNKRSLLDKLIMRVRVGKIVPLIPKGANLLDLGCGYRGELLTQVAEIIGEGVGVDLSVKNTRDTKIKLMEGRVDDPLPYPSGEADMVTALAIIEHVHLPELMLSESYRVLKRGGKLVVTTPSALGKWPLELLSRIHLISRAEIADHKRYYSKKSLELAIKQAGFGRVKVRHFGLAWLNLLAEGVK